MSGSGEPRLIRCSSATIAAGVGSLSFGPKYWTTIVETAAAVPPSAIKTARAMTSPRRPCLRRRTPESLRGSDRIRPRRASLRSSPWRTIGFARPRRGRRRRYSSNRSSESCQARLEAPPGPPSRVDPSSPGRAADHAWAARAGSISSQWTRRRSSRSASESAFRAAFSSAVGKLGTTASRRPASLRATASCRNDERRRPATTRRATPYSHGSASVGTSSSRRHATRNVSATRSPRGPASRRRA